MSFEPPALMGPNEVLLRASGVGKAYPADISPLQRLRLAVFGAQPKGKPPRVVLQGVDLEVRRGETLGVIGRNGAGKTTLLGILGNVIEPTTGTVERLGRVAVLLEIGSGFNPEFTGRDNAKLFCSIMGLSSRQIEERMPEVLAFSELGEYFDMPLRTYSSGMQARLGFSCAIQVDADLVIIDETLAVGDIAFRAKCYAKIKAMQQRGVTFLLVSHSPNLVANFCTRAIVLEKGEKVFDGATLGALDLYKDIREKLEAARRDKAGASQTGPADGALVLANIKFSQKTTPGVDVKACVLEADLIAREAVAHPIVSFGVRNHEGIGVCSYDSAQHGFEIGPMAAGETRRVMLRFENRLLPGSYFISARTARLVGEAPETIAVQHNIARLDLAGPNAAGGIIDVKMALSLPQAPAPQPATQTTQT